jgi:hypothetical protein
LIAAQKETLGLNKGALSRGSEKAPRDTLPTLAEAGIDKKLSSRAQKMAAIADNERTTLINENAKPIFDDLETWLHAQLPKITAGLAGQMLTMRLQEYAKDRKRFENRPYCFSRLKNKSRLIFPAGDKYIA